MVDWTNIGDEWGWGIRVRQTLECVCNGGAAYTADGLDQLRTEAEVIFDDDATSKKMFPTAIGFIHYAVAVINGLLTQCDNMIVDILKNRAYDEIDSTALPTDAAGLIGDIANAMRDDSKTVLQSTTTASAVTAGSTNTGTGSIAVSLLDTFNATDNAAQNQYFRAGCYADAITGGQSQHRELFQVSGSFGHYLPAVPSCTYPGADGTGYNGGQNRLQNPTTYSAGANTDTTIPFENFTTNVPTGWTVNTGTGGTNIDDDSSNYLFGSKSLTFIGDGGGTLMDIQQDANDLYGATSTDQKLDPLAHYLIGYWATNESGVVAGIVSMYMDGTAYSAGSTEKATKDFSASPPGSTWTFYSGVVKMPKAIPTDMHVHLKVTTAITNTKHIYIDGAVLAKMWRVPAWGLSFAIYSGGTAFVADDDDPDRFSWYTTNDFAGLFQEWCTRRSDPNDMLHMVYPNIGVALPSSGSPSSELLESKAQ